MRKLLCGIFLLIGLSGTAQSKYQLFVDSLGMIMSDYIDAHIEHFDSAAFVQYFSKIALQFDGAKDTMTLQQRKIFPALLTIRTMHHNSLVAQKLVQKIPKSKFWVHSTQMPPSAISQEDCAAFWRQRKFIYHDTDSTVVHLTLDNNYWIDTMADHTYSKLSVEKLNDQTFQSTFIESNNAVKT